MYFLSLFVIEFLRHWQLYQLRWNTPAGIESRMLCQGHAKVSPCGVGGETEMRNSARSMVMVPQTLETPIGCWASQSLGGNAWREGSWISLEIMRPMTHQLLEATDVGKSAGCLNPWGSTSSCRKPHLTGKHGKKQWEKHGSASAHAERAESQIQVCDTRRVGSAQLAKNAENSPSAHHSSLQSLWSELWDVSMKQRSSEMMMYDKT